MADEKSELKLYVVSHSEHSARLVWAKNKAQAIAHVTEPYTASLATPREALSLTRDGVEEETAA